MNRQTPPPSPVSFVDLPLDRDARHSVLVDVFGRWLMWHRARAVEVVKAFVRSSDARCKIGSSRSKRYDQVAKLAADDQEAAIGLAEETLDGFLESFIWSLGDEGVDCRFDNHYAYRFRIDVEIVEVDSMKIVEEEPVNRRGRFFGKNWGRWINSV